MNPDQTAPLSSADFFKKFFQEHYDSVKQFGSRSRPAFVGPDLDPNCLQQLSADDKSHNEERVNHELYPREQSVKSYSVLYLEVFSSQF